jgi:hypothetical protein
MWIDSTSILADARSGVKRLLRRAIRPFERRSPMAMAMAMANQFMGTSRLVGAGAVSRPWTVFSQNDGALISWTAALTAANDIRTQ